MSWRLAGQVEDIPPGQARFSSIAGEPVVIAHVQERFFAPGGLCPHRDNPLEGAQLWDHLIGCPWPHFQYDIRTGEN